MSQHSDVTHTDLTATKLFSHKREGMFQQDGTRVHMSKATVPWLDANIEYYILAEGWPPNSLDLSRTENVLSIMTTAVYSDPEPQPLQTLKHLSEKHGNQFLCQHFKTLSVRCLTD